MADVFISYSRKNIAFARLLHEALKKNQFETWIDWQDIPPSTDWLAEVYEAIEQANDFIFIISQASVDSEICRLEIEHAVKNNKRLIPLVVNDVDPKVVHPALSSINWIFCQEEDKLQSGFQLLMEAIQTDYAWVKEHTRLQVRSLEWERKRYDKSYLLQGGELELAESWLAQAAEKDRKPTALQVQYLLAGRQQATRRQRLAIGAMLTGLVIAIGLGIFAWTQRNQAVYEGYIRATSQAEAIAESHARATAQAISEAASTQAVAQKNEAERQARLARAGFFSVESLSHLGDRLDLALLLSVEAIHNADTIQSRSSMLSALEYYPQLTRFLHGHSGQISSVTFSPDGQILASAGCAKSDPRLGVGSCSQGEILLWEIPSGQLRDRLLTSHTTFTSDLVFSPDGKMLVSSSWDGSIIFWDVESRQPIGDPILSSQGRVRDLAFSPDGKTIASCHELIDSQSGRISGEIRFWDAANQQLVDVLSFPFQVAFSHLAYNPNGGSLAAATSSATLVRLWETDTLTPIPGVFEDYQDVVYSLAYSPNGQILALGNYDGSVILWDLTANQPIGSPLEGHTDMVNSVAFSPDGSILASSGTDKTIRLWDVSSGQPLEDPLIGHTENVASVAFHPNGDFFASGGEDGTVILWNLQDRSSLAQTLRGHSAAVWDVAFSLDGSLLASASADNTISLWDMTNELIPERSLYAHQGEVYQVAFSPDGKLLASGGQDATVRLWDTVSRQQTGLSLEGHEGIVVSLAFSPDGKTLASGGMDHAIYLWEVSTGKRLDPPLSGHLSTVTSLTFSPDGKMLVSGGCTEPIGEEYCKAGEMRVWDLDGEEITSQPLIGHTQYIYALAFSPDGKILASGSADETILFWDLESGQPIGEPIERHKHVVTSLTFSPDGKILASGSVDQSISLMDVESRQTIGQPLTGHQDAVTSLSFSPDGHTLASGSFDSTIILWDLDPESWLVKACQRAGRNLSPAEWLIYFPDDLYHKTCQDFP